MIGRNFGFFGAPVMGLSFGAPSLNIDFGPRHHGYCSNPFGSFMGGFFGGLGVAAACNFGGGSYVGYPSVGPSVWTNSAPVYQTYSSYPVMQMGGFNFTGESPSTNMLLGGLFERFRSNWGLNVNGNSSTAFPFLSFGNLTQAGHMPFPLTTTSPFTPQASAQTSQPSTQTSGSANQGSTNAGQQQGAVATGETSATASGQQQDTKAGGVTPGNNQSANEETETLESGITGQDTSEKINKLDEEIKKLKVEKQALEAEKQKLGEPPKVDGRIDRFEPAGQKYVDLDVQIFAKQAEINNLDKITRQDILDSNRKLDYLSNPPPNKDYNREDSSVVEPQKDEATIQAQEAEFAAKCKDGVTCRDKKDIKRGYYRTFEAPESTLAVIPMDYRYEKFDGLDDKYRANKEALAHYIDLCEAAKQDGELIETKSAFRNEKMQAREVKIEGENIAAPPGYSEHATGFAFDIKNFTEDNIGYSTQYLWLQKNAKYFGFEISYPYKNEQGVTAEPWHIRFNQKLLDKYGGKFKPKFENSNNKVEYLKDIPGFTAEEAVNIPRTVQEVTAVENEIKQILAKPITTSNREALKQQYDELHELGIKYANSPATEKLTKLVPKSLGKNRDNKEVKVNTLESEEIQDKVLRRENKLLQLMKSHD